MLSDTKRAVISFFYPNRCPFCDGIIGAYEYCCAECAALIRRIEKSPVPPANISELFSCCEYSGRARKAVLRLKDGSYAYSAETFGFMMTENIGEKIRGYDALVPVPSSHASVLRRGYAPAAKIAREISRRSGIRMIRLLKATGAKNEQKRLSAAQRIENASESFRLSPFANARGMRLLLVDDIITTGATLGACASLLCKAGAEDVGAAVFAVTTKGEKT